MPAGLRAGWYPRVRGLHLDTFPVILGKLLLLTYSEQKSCWSHHQRPDPLIGVLADATITPVMLISRGQHMRETEEAVSHGYILYMLCLVNPESCLNEWFMIRGISSTSILGCLKVYPLAHWDGISLQLLVGHWRALTHWNLRVQPYETIASMDPQDLTSSTLHILALVRFPWRLRPRLKQKHKYDFKGLPSREKGFPRIRYYQPLIGGKIFGRSWGYTTRGDFCMYGYDMRTI